MLDLTGSTRRRIVRNVAYKRELELVVAVRLRL